MQKRLFVFSHLRAEAGLVVILAVVALALGVSQTLLYAANVPQGTVYPLVHNFTEDYYYYLHLIRQGMDGAWLATSKLTPEVFPGKFVNPFFLLLGHAARTFAVSPEGMYLLARIGGGALLLAGVYALAFLLYPVSRTRRVVAFVFAVFGTYIWDQTATGPMIESLTRQWNELDPMVRLTYIPHHLWSKAFMVWTFVALLAGLTVRDKRIWVIPAVCFTVIMGFTSPVTIATFVPVIGLWVFFEAVRSVIRTRKLPDIASFVPGILAAVIAVTIALYHRQVEHSVFPWTSYLPWENFMRYDVKPIAYLKSLGPNFWLFLLAVPFLWKSSSGRIVLAWGLSGWVMLYAASPFVPLSNTRFLEGYQFLAVGLGAAAGLKELISFLERKAGKYRAAIGPVIFLAWMSLTLVSWSTSAAEHWSYIRLNRDNFQIYVPHSVIGVFSVLARERQGVVLSERVIGSMLPAYTHLRSVLGHPLMTLDESQKIEEANLFYGYSDAAFAKEFLQKYRVGYIVFPLSKRPPEAFLSAIAFRPVYQNASYLIARKE